MLTSVFVEDISFWSAQVTLVNIAVAIAAISVLRLLQGLLAGVNSTEELSKKDNFAFGVSLAGSAIALALILSSAVSGDVADTLVNELINIVAFAGAGIVLLKLGSLINDYLIFHKLSIKQQIAAENMAVGVVQASNFIALGILIKAAIAWSAYDDYRGLLSVCIIFFCGQIILLGVTRLRAAIYSSRHGGVSLQSAFADGHIPLAIRYGGHIIGTSLAVSSASTFVEHTSFWFWESILGWFVVAVVFAFALFILAALARSIILRKINVVEEVDKQHNKGVAFIEAAIFIAIGLIIKALMG